MKLIMIIAALLTIAMAGCGGGKRASTVDTIKVDVKRLNLRGNEFYYQGRYDDAARFYGRALSISERIDHEEGVAESLNNLGQLYLVAGSYDDACTKFREALEINDRIGNLKGAGANLNNIGSAQMAKDDLVSARSSFLEAMKRYRDAKDGEGVATVLSNEALIDIESGELASARDKLSQSLAISIPKKLHRLSATSHYSLGRLAEKEGDFEAALQGYDRALAEDKLVEYSAGISKDLDALARVNRALGRDAEADDYMNRARKSKELP
ncbi:MAG: Photosystem I assembly protein Ycf3 [bacterium ADurb.Bin270]|nr:tetratricopeptide repeat protein [Myxococcales bacterium]OQA59156.1 MAG: Photosystem I assembly protein Ycf3 [bacterium ADurb.Bin270]HQH80642.1 tetratricopeptide repeat protein [bacterium]